MEPVSDAIYTIDVATSKVLFSSQLPYQRCFLWSSSVILPKKIPRNGAVCIQIFYQNISDILEQSLSAGDRIFPHPNGQMVALPNTRHNEDQGAVTFNVLNVYLKPICRILQTIELVKGQPGPGSKSYWAPYV